ncbi:MAG: hypothetical protein ABEJ88_05235 [Halobacterium sp.]
MSEYDSDSSAVTEPDSDLKQAIGVAERAVARHDLTAKLAVTTVAFVLLGLAVRMRYTSQMGDNMGAIIVWFSLIFAAGAAILGGVVKVWGAVQRYRHSWE